MSIKINGIKDLRNTLGDNNNFLVDIKRANETAISEMLRTKFRNFVEERTNSYRLPLENCTLHRVFIQEEDIQIVFNSEVSDREFEALEKRHEIAVLNQEWVR